MALEFRPLLAEHLRYIEAQPEQRMDQIGMLLPSYAAVLADNVALSAWSSGRCVAAAGVVVLIPSRLALAWALFSPDAWGHALAICRKMRTVLALIPEDRVELTVRAGFLEGMRFAECLGFECDTPTPLRKRGAHGEDELIYSRVR